MTPHALRTAVGDRAFFRITRVWATEHHDGHGTTAQLVRVAERVSGKNLGAPLHTWPYAPGKPNKPRDRTSPRDRTRRRT
ncbi:hypothetical protein SNL152K_10391 [Streptomyces sp. NL15-2K]|nr:hypothetical protein [Kutzneria buriramensis]WKX15600.1 hypothetical protein Q4V64_52110 [Kutzneria buriramensis]GCB53034.1 hypothetical protein SNL152K_10391 [Streptomyces sp. NL15-2K]